MTALREKIALCVGIAFAVSGCHNHDFARTQKANGVTFTQIGDDYTGTTTETICLQDEHHRYCGAPKVTRYEHGKPVMTDLQISFPMLKEMIPNRDKQWWQFWKPSERAVYISQTPQLTLAEQREYDRRKAGRNIYYVDDKGWPIPEGRRP